MRKVRDCLLRSVLLRCLCLLLASLTLLSITSIESNAQEAVSDDGFSDEYIVLSSEEVQKYSITDTNNFADNRTYVCHNLTDTTPNFDLYSGNLDSNVLYEVELDFSFNINADTPVYFRNVLLMYNDLFIDYLYSPSDVSLSSNLSFVGQSKIYAYGSQLKNGCLEYTSRILAHQAFNVNYSLNFTYEILSCKPVSSVNSDDYQSGYNAGYSAGENAGYDIGYSEGVVEGEQSGFQAGVDSVDTDSYYNAGYSAGYNAGYQKAYDSGYNAGLESARKSAGEWGTVSFLKPPQNYLLEGNEFYVTSYGLVDMEQYQSGSNGYFYNTVPGTYSGYSEINFAIPFMDLNGGSLYRIDSNKFQVEFSMNNMDAYMTYNVASAALSANLFNSEVVEAYVTYNGKKYHGAITSNGDVYFNFQVETLASPTWIANTDMAVTLKLHNNVCLVTDADITHYVGGAFTPKVHFTLGVGDYAVYIRPYYENDNVSAGLENQTQEITGALDKQQQIQQNQLEETQKQTEEMEEQTETQKGIAGSIKEFFGSFFQNLIDSIIGIFVPSQEEMGELFNRLNDFFAETFGFLYYPFDFIIDAFNIFLEADSETGLTLPGFSIMGYEVWGNQTYDLTSEPVVDTIFGYVRMGTGAMLAMWFVNYLRNFFDKRFGGGGN